MTGSYAQKGDDVEFNEVQGSNEVNRVLDELRSNLRDANEKVSTTQSELDGKTTAFESITKELSKTNDSLQTAKVRLEEVVSGEDKRLLNFFEIVRRIEWGNTSYEETKGKSPKGRFVADRTSNLYIPVVDPNQTFEKVEDIYMYVATAIVVEPEVTLESEKCVGRVKPLLTQEDLDREVGNASVWIEETPVGHIYYLVAALYDEQYASLKNTKLLQGSGSKRFDLKRAGDLPKSETYGALIPPPSNGRDDDSVAPGGSAPSAPVPPAAPSTDVTPSVDGGSVPSVESGTEPKV